jgi:hypothetical protein
MRTNVARIFLGMVLVAGVTIAVVPQASAGDTAVVRCSNGFRREVPAPAARGIATAIVAFSAHTNRPVSCVPTVGTTLPGPPTTVGCNNGFRREVPAQAARGIATALEAFGRHTNRPVSCFPD